MDAAAQAADRTHQRMESLDRAGAGLAKVGAVIAVGVGLAVKAYAEFDEQMSKVQAATHASAGEMKQLREAAISAGADTSFSAKEAGQAIEELSKAGVDTADILSGGLSGALSLAAAGSMEVADAAEIAATAMVQFKLSGQDIPHVADLLAAGAGKAQGSVHDMGMALKQGGLVASSFGLSIDETVGTLAAFASAGLLGSDAGTALKTSLIALANPSKESAAKMRELGINAYDAQGNFVGMSKLAGNLQDSLGDLTQEQRNQALATIFGSDAIRVANILFEQGEKGINKWTGAVNDSGYAANTASIQQNNLKGDIEKLTGSIDSVFLKSGSGMNDMLREMARGAEGLVDAIGSIPAPILSTGLSLAGMAGALALVGGGVLSAIPRITAARAAWQDFATANTRLSSALTRTAKVAGVAVAALVALQIVAAVQKSFEKPVAGIEDFNQALLKMDVSGFNKGFAGLHHEVNGVGDALYRLGNLDVNDAGNKFFSGLLGFSSGISRVQEATDNMDRSLSGLVQNGGLARAGGAFQMIAEEADKSAQANGKVGMSAQDVLKLMPSYSAALKEQATELGVNATEAELLELAYGRVPPRLQELATQNGKTAELQKIQAEASEGQIKALAEVGLAADGTVASLGKLLDAMFATGIASMSARDAEAAYQETLYGLKTKIDEVTASQSAGNSVWDAAKGTFDVTSEAGRAANEVFGELETKARNSAQAMANNGATQQELQGNLRRSYDDLYATARAFGASEQKADDLARAALGIPKGVPIEVAIQNFADSMAKLNGVDSKATEMNGKRVSVYIDTFQTTYEDRVVRSGGDEPSGGGLYGSDQRAEGGQIRPLYRALGGGITQYLASGGRARTYAMIPNGTDTVPIMGTPGEFMIKRSSARSLGYEQLASANATGRWPGSGQSGPVVNQTNYITEANDGAGVATDVMRRLAFASA
jgi:TP901 family phage tail tape measure protein